MELHLGKRDEQQPCCVASHLISEEKKAKDLKELDLDWDSLGRHCLKLPDKNKEVCLPNNFAVAKQRIPGLRRKFLNSKRLHQEYAGYMNTLIRKNYAEQVHHQTVAWCGGGGISLTTVSII